MNYDTYDAINYRAGQCVAEAYRNMNDTERVIDLCLTAGRLRGYLTAGLPIDSTSMQFTLDQATRLLRESQHVPAGSNNRGEVT